MRGIGSQQIMQLQAGVFPIHPADFSRVVAVWEAYVRATHHFVSEADIQIFKPLVRHALPHMAALACVRDGSQQVAGFIAVVDGKVEMLSSRIPCCTGRSHCVAGAGPGN